MFPGDVRRGDQTSQTEHQSICTEAIELCYFIQGLELW